MKNIGKPCAGKPHARFDEGGQATACSLLYLYFVGLVLGCIQRHGLLDRQQPIQGIEGIRMGQRRASDVADLLTAIGVGVVQIIVLADDARCERTIDHLGEGVVGEVGIAAIHAVGQPFLFETAAGIVPVALGQPLAHRAIVRRPDAGQTAGGVVQIVGLISFAIGDFIQQAAGAVASIQVPPLEVIVEWAMA